MTVPDERSEPDSRTSSWLARQWRWLRGQPRGGDAILADVGADARGVAVGKNIIQIGTLAIPVIYVALISLALVGLLAISSYRALAPLVLPQRMPDGQFNIAVAAFSAVDGDGQPVRNPDARELAISAANFVRDQKDALEIIVGSTVTVWGPQQRIRPLAEADAAARAEALNADVLVYGTLQEVGPDRWALQPSFYLSDRAIRRAEELGGEHALGRPIAYRTDSAASTREFNQSLQARLKALTQILLGISYMALGERGDFEQAVTILQRAAEDPAWAAAEGAGQEVLYLFLGSAYLELSSLVGDDAPERRELLDASRTAFETAIALNPDYVRSYNGLGAALQRMAKPPNSIDAECAWQWDLLDDADAAFAHALFLPESVKPPSGHVDFMAHFGLGRSGLWYGLCAAEWGAAEQEWKEAAAHYTAALTHYESLAEPPRYLTAIASFAHIDLGLMAQIRSDVLWERAPEQSDTYLQQAIDHYAQAFTLIEQADTEIARTHGQEAMSLYLTALCLDGQGARAERELDTFLAAAADPDGVRTAILETLAETLDWEECTHE